MKLHDTRLWCWLLIILILLGITSALVGCKSAQKVVTRQTYISDHQSHWDSIFNARVSATFEQFQKVQKEQRETSRVETNHIRDSTSTTIDKNGNIVRQDKYHYESHNYTEKDVQKLKDSVSMYKAYKDSINGYKLKIDSLSKAKQDSIPYPVYIEKQLDKADKMFLQFGKVAFFVLLAIVAMLIILPIVKAKIK